MTKKRVKVRGKGKRKAAPGGERVSSGNGKKAPSGLRLKYGFDSLQKGESLTIPDADKPAGAVTVRENVRILAYEFGLRNKMRFKVSGIEGTQCTVTRIK